jgi:hypothetical protein
MKPTVLLVAAGLLAGIAAPVRAESPTKTPAPPRAESPGAIPSGAPNCNVEKPPADAGAYVTPGGFVLVYPRNAAINDDYTGCKGLWVVDSPENINRLMTLYFERGALRIVVGYDGRGESTEPRATCVLPEKTGNCGGVDGNEFVALKLPTWPRMCMDRPDDPKCAVEPD